MVMHKKYPMYLGGEIYIQGIVLNLRIQCAFRRGLGIALNLNPT